MLSAAAVLQYGGSGVRATAIIMVRHHLRRAAALLLPFEAVPPPHALEARRQLLQSVLLP